MQTSLASATGVSPWVSTLWMLPILSLRHFLVISGHLVASLCEHHQEESTLMSSAHSMLSPMKLSQSQTIHILMHKAFVPCSCSLLLCTSIFLSHSCWTMRDIKNVLLCKS